MNFRENEQKQFNTKIQTNTENHMPKFQRYSIGSCKLMFRLFRRKIFSSQNIFNKNDFLENIF
jgi:pectin methylesterase-like acyl-CoA thioesterase